MATNKRSKAYRLSIFNHKGGVGKTTLTINVAATLASMGKRVLLVDSDPQCNLTAHLLDTAVVDDLLDQSDSDSGQTLWSALKPISEALGDAKSIKPLELSYNNLFLIPGDIRLSEFETDLADFWAQCLQRKQRGFRGTTALSSLINRISTKLEIDYVFYDSGPNIGPLNRTILLDCDGFIAPVACDLFSLRALKTLGRTLLQWIREWETISDLAPQDLYLLPGKPRFVGYIPEGFKVYGGQVAGQHSRYLSKIEKEIHSQIISHLRQVSPDLAAGRLLDFKLGEVKHFGCLVPASMEQGTTIGGVNAGTPEQRQSAEKVFKTIAEKIIEKTT